ncbi:MAG TPA: membrane protein insertase YidC [Bacteroidales bacterium]|nr:membrane protein insertase YidC [Bacteroidales bacterium]
MDKNTITGIILIFAIFVGFSIYNNQKANKGFKEAVAAAEAQISQGNFERARTEYVNALRFKPNQPEVLAEISKLNDKLGISTDSISENPDTTEKTSTTELPAAAPPATADLNQQGADIYGPFSSSSSGENEFITLENNLLELKISPKGGRVWSARIKEYQTHDSMPLILFSGDSTIFGFNFFTSDNRVVQTNELFFTPLSDNKSFFVQDSSETVVLRLYAGDDKYIEYRYTLEPDKYSVNFDVVFRNLTGIIPANQTNITLDWRMYIPQQEKGRDNENNYTTIKYKYFEDEVSGLRLRSQKETDTEDITTRLSWVAFQDQFFSSVLIADEYFQSGSVSSLRTNDSPKYHRYFTAELAVPYIAGTESNIDFKFYFGPNHIGTLRKEGQDLDKIVFLGRNIIGWISRFVIIPVFNWLEKYISSYGIIILILTVLIKLVLFPLTYKSFQSTAKMGILKPMVDEIGKKYPKQEDAMKKQQATMDLYKRAGVNPMGGCLPMLLQFPILFAMFRFFPVSIELRQEAFLWATDLSTYDSILNLPFTIPMYGDHVSLFTILMTVSSLLTMKMTGTSPGSDQPGMKIMMYMMPIMFMVILNKFSAGLTYYYFLANMLTWIQNTVMKRFINADEVLATLEANKKKPVPKSKWQQRLEAAAKQRGINPSRK